ncbi:pectate lyase [Caldalkalibacillus salinus]|uniref:pectate lyase n=1 Tax=Caldalkalibacillus salinus TaxID=2803787 RepID=UPI001922E49D|nr:pectate lyase [Caldalkalibacillus salinus]
MRLRLTFYPFLLVLILFLTTVQPSNMQAKDPSTFIKSVADQTNVYEAEDATGEGIIVDDKHPGYTGTGFIDFVPNAPGGYIEWQVEVPEDGAFTLAFRYAHGKPDNRYAEVSVNGEVVTPELDFHSTGDFINYEYVHTTAQLQAGDNTVRLTALAPEGGANLDHLYVYQPFDETYEAEEATGEGIIVDNKHPGYTGTGFVDYVPNAPGGYIEWTVDIPSEGEYTLEFRYAHGGTDNRKKDIRVNDEMVINDLDFTPTGDWTQWHTSATQVALPAGEVLIRATGVESNGGANIDHLRIHNLLDENEEPVQMEMVELSEIVSGLELKKLESLGLIAPEVRDENRPLTRLAFMAMVNEAFGYVDNETFVGIETQDSIWEVAEQEWYAYVLKAAQEAGYMRSDDGQIQPFDHMSRLDTAIAISYLLDLEPNPNAAKRFQDVDDMPDKSKGAIGAAASKGYMRALASGKFGVSEPLTYTEAEALIERISPTETQEARVVSADVVADNIVLVTLNTTFEDVDFNDVALQIPAGSWDTLTPTLKTFAASKVAQAQNMFGHTVLVYETVHPLGENATYSESDDTTFTGDLEDAIRRAERYVSWQMDHGGWTKGMDYSRMWDGSERKSNQLGPDGETELGTIDNDATIREMRLIAEVYRETGDEVFKESVQKGLDFLLTMQYPTGGWPQVYPQRGEEGSSVYYSNYVTFNDDAMINVLNLIDDILQKRYPFDEDIIDPQYYDRLQAAEEKGIDYILNSQIEVDGVLTAWCAQHDPDTYEPQGARSYEHPSISGSESVGIVSYLMSRPNQTEEITEAIQGALTWFDEVKLEGIRYVSADPNGEYFVEDPNAVTWYRFYDIGTNLPIFSGRDGVIKRDIREIEQERRDGYSWGGNYAEQLLEVAQTTGYFENKVYASVVHNASTNTEGQALVVGDRQQVKEQRPKMEALPNTLTVSKDGTGDYTTVQEAIDAVPSNNTQPVEIHISNGIYEEVVTVPADKPYISIIGESAEDTVITYDNYAGKERPNGGTYGTSGSASVFLRASDFTAKDITFENAFDRTLDVSGKQAVAVYASGERMAFYNTRFLGHQDTLFVHSGSQYFYQSYIEGDVDFIFGGARAVFEECTIFSLDRGSDSNNGYVTAASTLITQPYGLLFLNSRFESDAPAGTVYLGRPWHPSGNPDAIGSVVIMNSYLGEHIKEVPWTDMSGFSWEDARFYEYQNEGPGAVLNDSRAQLSDEEAAALTVETVLDGWQPKQ